jgi:hypothetical protein
MNAPATHEAVASPIVEYSNTAAALSELRTRYSGATYAVQTTVGMREARAARATLRDLRTSLEAKRQELKAPILDRGRLLDSEAKRITAELVALEDPIDAQIRAEEDRKAQERVRAEQAERERVAAIDKRIDWIRGRTSEAVRMRTAAEVEVIVRQLAEVPLTEELYAEKLPIATELHASELAWLRGHAAALAEREAEVARIAQEREQIEAEKRAEQERRDREDQARREEQARQDAERAAKIAQEDAERQARQRADDEARAVATRANGDRLAEALVAREKEAQEAREADDRAAKAMAEKRAEIRAQAEEEADPWAALEKISTIVERLRSGWNKAPSDNPSVLYAEIARVIDAVVLARNTIDALDA